jgi:hypothetical protein
VRDIPATLLDEVLGPLPDMPEREFWHLGRAGAPLGVPIVALCGETFTATGLVARICRGHCPDCIRIAKAKGWIR